MYLSRKLVGFVIIALLMGGAGYFNAIGLVLPIYVVFFVGALLITSLVLKWVGSEPPLEEESQRKVEKLLRDLDDNDLNLLRTRLLDEDRNNDYGSMNELMESGKRKNEVR